MIGALGVVFGDIGTSPIYTIQTVFNPGDPHPVPISGDNVYGVVSTIFWSVMIIVTLTYVMLVMRADNDGEGGIMALITLLRRWTGRRGRRTAMFLAGLGLFGAALFFGDSMITPAISVLSAVEGLKVINPDFGDFVVPITAVIIVGLFSVQRHGTAAVGRFFGPVMIAWFAAIGACGVSGIAGNPEILKALSPTYAVTFLAGHFHIAFFSLAAIVLAVTGAEALYADMGHFGRKAITYGWLGLVLPACTLSYFGQGALVLADESQVSAPFFLLTPEWARIPDGAAGDGGDGDRIAGGDHRSVLGGVAGGPARLPAAAAHRAHVGLDDRPDLRAVDQRAADGLGADPRLRVPQLGRAGVRVRHGGDRDDHHHHPAVLLLRPHPVGHGRCGS